MHFDAAEGGEFALGGALGLAMGAYQAAEGLD